MSKKLYFRFGAMNSGKSTNLLQVAFNYRERGMKVFIIKPAIDTKSEYVVSRIGAKAKVDLAVESGMSICQQLIEHMKTSRVDCILVDESQFLDVRQIDELFLIAVKWDIPVIAYGLRTDFITHSFPGSQRLLEIAHRTEELKTICQCGQKAVFNGRKIDGIYVQTGDTVAIDGEVEYQSLCGGCYLEKVGPISGD